MLGLLVLVVLAGLSVLVGAGGLGWQRVLGEIVAQLTGGKSPASERESAMIWQLRVSWGVLAGIRWSGAGQVGRRVPRGLPKPARRSVPARCRGRGRDGGDIVVVLLPATPGWVVGPLPLAAFAGALGGVGLSWLLGRSSGGTGTATLLLAGWRWGCS